MGRRLLFLVNPVSGTGDKEKLKKRIGDRCEAEQVDYAIIPTSKNGDYQFLKEKIAADKITDIIICGGDGSIAPVVSAINGQPVQVGLIPMGSGNGLARTVKIPCKLAKALDNIFEGEGKWVDAYEVNGTVCCHLFGLGFDGLIAKEFSESRTRGLNTYLRLVMKRIVNPRKYTFSFDADGQHFTTNAFLLTIANSNQFGNSFKIAPFASLSDGILDMVVVRGDSVSKIILPALKYLSFPSSKLLKQDEELKKGFNYYQGKSFKVWNPDMAPAHFDGEPVAPQDEYEISVLPSAYKLIVPKA